MFSELCRCFQSKKKSDDVDKFCDLHFFSKAAKQVKMLFVSAYAGGHLPGNFETWAVKAGYGPVWLWQVRSLP